MKTVFYGRLSRYHLMRAAIGVAHHDGTALFASDASAVQIIVAYYAGSFSSCFSVCYPCGQRYDIIILPYSCRLIACRCILVCHIDIYLNFNELLILMYVLFKFR